MNTWSDLFEFAYEWLSAIWNGIFQIEFFDGLTFQLLYAFIIIAVLAITIIKYFISNTHASVGITEGTTYHDDSTSSHFKNYKHGFRGRF